jgi:transcriptional regulator of heat shock response
LHRELEEEDTVMHLDRELEERDISSFKRIVQVRLGNTTLTERAWRVLRKTEEEYDRAYERIMGSRRKSHNEVKANASPPR